MGRFDWTRFRNVWIHLRHLLWTSDLAYWSLFAFWINSCRRLALAVWFNAVTRFAFSGHFPSSVCIFVLFEHCWLVLATSWNWRSMLANAFPTIPINGSYMASGKLNESLKNEISVDGNDLRSFESLLNDVRHSWFDARSKKKTNDMSNSAITGCIPSMHLFFTPIANKINRRLFGFTQNSRSAFTRCWALIADKIAIKIIFLWVIALLCKTVSSLWIRLTTPFRRSVFI